MELLRPYGQYWFVTITPYGPEIEPHVPPKAQVLQDFITLSKIVGPDCIAWRYDPIFLSDTYTLRDISLNSSRWHLYFPAIPGPV